MTKRKRAAAPKTVIGWREHIGLPEFGIDSMPAKVDTGAKTSALHAVDQELLEIDGDTWVEFMIPVHNRRTSRRLRAPFLEERDIKNTGGVPERRLIVRTKLHIAHRTWSIDISLANRKKMEFDIILGRTAIRDHQLVVDPGRSFVLGQPVVPERPQGVSSHLSDDLRQGEFE